MNEISNNTDIGKVAPGNENIDLSDGQGAGLLDYRLDPSMFGDNQVKKHITDVPISSLKNTAFYRSNPNKGWSFPAPVIEFDRDPYIVSKNLCAELENDIVLKEFHLFTNRQGDIQLWGLRLPDQLGRLNGWSKSGFEAVKIAQSEWIRVKANMEMGLYDIYTATADLPDPEWPDMSFEEILAIAFKDRTIDSLDHPIVKKLRGEI